MKIINLKKNTVFIDQYLVLRNAHADALLSTQVQKDETLQWLQNTSIEIIGLVENDILEGVALVNRERDAEISFFVRTPNKGVGTTLLEAIEKVAQKKGLTHL